MLVVRRLSLIKIVPVAFILAIAFALASFATHPVSAAGCVADGGSTGESSPFNATKGMCLGQGDAGKRYYQFAVNIPVDIARVNVTGQNGNGQSITFRKENTNQYVSDTSFDFKGMGYPASTAAGCNVNDPVYKISIRAIGGSGKIVNGVDHQLQDFTINLCSNTYYGGGNYVTYVNATNLVGDNGQGAPVGTLVGNFGITRNADAPAPNTLLTTAGVKSISIKGGSINLSGDSVSHDWFDLTNGKLTLKDGLPPGLYTLDLHYNDCSQIVHDNPPGDTSMTSCDIPIKVPNFKIVAGQTTYIPNSDQSVQYYDKDGKTVEPRATKADENASTCNVEGVGWIICPVMRLMANVVDAAYGFVSSLLLVQPLMTTGSTAGVYSAWSAMRSFANIAFVIAFIIIIYSQLTGAGINNYGIKKMLPRLIVAAILVNVSYWICAIAVDLSNIIGSSVNGLFQNAIPAVDTPNQSKIGDAAAGTGALGWVGITGVVLASAVAVLYIGLSALLPAILAALLAIVTVFLVLTLRQALIILLVIISPLAFVAYLLPNTEGMFKKWRELFQTLLLMFPIIAFLFGASSLASAIVMAGASGTYKIAVQIMGALIAIIPLALTPIVMKTAGGVLNRFGGMVNNPNKGPFDRMKKGAEGIRNRQQDRRAIRSMNGGNVFGGGQFRRQAKREAVEASLKRERSNQSQQYVASEAMKTVKNPTTGEEETVATRFGRQLAGGMGADTAAIQSALASAQFTIDEAIAKEIKAESVMVRDMGKDQLKGVIADGKASDARKAAAMQRLVRVSDPIDYETEINDAINSDSSVLRRATAEALGSDGPGFVKASDVDRIASGAMKKENEDNIKNGRETTSLSTIARDNTAAGVMSAEKIVNETNGSIQYAYDHSEDGPNGGKQRLVNASAEAQRNDQLKGKIKHNVAAISSLTNGAKHIARAAPIVYTKTDSRGIVTTTINSTELNIS
jgi:hypothetical protein